jgi:hypothetical protein
MPGPCAEGWRRGRSRSARRSGRRSAGFGEVRDARSVVDGGGASDSFLLTQDGHAQYLDAGQGLLLGAGSGTLGSRPNAAQSLPPGSTLLLYTDGLIEIPGSDLDTGLTRLRHHALALTHEALDTLCDQLLDRMPPGNTDDVALLAPRIPP